jgi:hypothetical protein
MSLKINSQAANSTAKTTQREINFRQWRRTQSAIFTVRTERGCLTILLVPGTKILTSLFGTRTLGDFRALRLVLEMLAQRRGGHPTSPHLWSDDSQLFGMRPSSSSPPTERRPSPSS